MSKINDGLFMCGEILNLHGDCGGYNLHLAWTTGRIAGNSVAEYLGRL
jgi:predicted flavoprotein YhiN